MNRAVRIDEGPTDGHWVDFCDKHCIDDGGKNCSDSRSRISYRIPCDIAECYIERSSLCAAPLQQSHYRCPVFWSAAPIYFHRRIRDRLEVNLEIINVDSRRGWFSSLGNCSKRAVECMTQYFWNTTVLLNPLSYAFSRNQIMGFLHWPNDFPDFS